MTLLNSRPTNAPPQPSTARRWLVLALIAVCQLMLVLDSSIVTIALPQAQQELSISDADRQWVVTAYHLVFGSLLLLGGRIADLAGRKKILVVSLFGFAVASALGGFATSAAMLFAARGLQGVFAAAMAPAALSLLSVTFVERRERAIAFSVYGSVSGGGVAIGLILGGLLTEFTSWRWCLLVNVPIALATAAAALWLLKESRTTTTARYDIPGALTSTLGLVALVYGFTTAAHQGWDAPVTIGLLGAGVALLIGFVAIETRTAHPLLPLRVILDRRRGAAFLAGLLSAAGLFAMFLFLTYYLQGTMGYSALLAAAAFLPFSVGIVAGAALTNVLLPRFGSRTVLTVGLVLAAAGLAWFSQVQLAGTYLVHVLPGELLVSLGMGLTFVIISSTALHGVSDDESGVASAFVNTTQQVGGSLGTALLSTLAAGATTGYLMTHPQAAAAATVHGYQLAFSIAAATLLLGAILTATLIPPTRRRGTATERTAQ